MRDMNIGLLQATSDGDKVWFDLGATEAHVHGSLTDVLESLSPLMLTAIETVRDGGILRLDAMLGKRLIDLSDGKARVEDPDKWYGVIQAVGLFVGPFDRKSQAMNALPLALLGVELKAKTAPVPEPVEVKLDDLPEVIHLGDGSKPFDISRAAARHMALRRAAAMSGESLEESLESFRQEVGEPLVELAKSLSPELGELFRKSLDETIVDIRAAGKTIATS